MRGHSYYTNDPKANDTDIDKSVEIESLLDYKSNNTCFFCVCSTSGHDIACIPRSLWFCDYIRFLREPNAMRNYYTHIFKQDRPSYNRLLSWRMRRTMDNAIYDFIDVLDNGRLRCEVWFWVWSGWLESASILSMCTFSLSFRCCVLSECFICILCKTAGFIAASPFATNLAKLT